MNVSLEELKNKCIVIDVETCASYSDGRPIDIRTCFEDYVERAEVKFFGCYSFKYNKYVCDQVEGNEQRIRDFINEHDTIVSFNGTEFDVPILYNNRLMPEDKRFLQVDLLQILGASTYITHNGLPFKNRGQLMGYKFKRNSLKAMAEAMKLETQKGSISYNIFFQDEYTDEERKNIIKYLESDVKATTQMYIKTFDFWSPFTKFISDKNIKNLSWIRSSIASLTYKAACHTLDVEETYAEKPEKAKEEMGGRVIEPKYEEARDVWYVDFTSLYPHIYTMFNLFSEVSEDERATLFNCQLTSDAYDKIWHGNDVFEVKGYYDISKHHPLAEDVAEKLKTRIKLKKEDPNNPMTYAIKIFLNSLYGAQRSAVFEQIHTPNGGWDCCWLGQQIQKLTEDMMTEFGFETIAGDTDSIFVKLMKGLKIENDYTEEEYVRDCLAKVVQKIKDNVPFPCDTFNIDIEHYVDYIMWSFSMQPIQDVNGINLKNEKGRLIKEYKGKKKNYVYMYKKGDELKLKIMGLPIIKDNATALGQKMLKDVIRPTILSEKTAKFSKETINKWLASYLDDLENLNLLSVEYKVKPAASYKKDSQIQCQISNGYFQGQSGVIRLIKNKKYGNAGKTAKYCTVDEVIEQGLTIDDMDLTKITNELLPFVEGGNNNGNKKT